MASLVNVKWCEKGWKNYGNPGKWGLRAKAFQWIPTWQSLKGFQNFLHSCAFDESSLSIERVNEPKLIEIVWFLPADCVCIPSVACTSTVARWVHGKESCSVSWAGSEAPIPDWGCGRHFYKIQNSLQNYNKAQLWLIQIFVLLALKTFFSFGHDWTYW